MLIILTCPMAFSFQHNSVSFKLRDNYFWFMDGETEVLKEHKDWILVFANQFIKFFFFLKSYSRRFQLFN